MRETFSFDRFQVNVATRECSREGERIPLTGKMFDTLVVLLRHHDRVVSKEELMKAVWHEAFVSDDSLTQVIKGLRKLLGDHATSPAYIATISGRGYRFVAPVHVITPAEEATAAPEPPPPALPHLPVHHDRPAGRSITRGMIALALMLAIGVGAYVAGRSAPRPAALGPLHVNVDVPPGLTIESGPSLSPDGRLLAFVATSAADRRTLLWVRDLTTGQARPLEGTDGAARPFWSPDNRQVAYFAAGAVQVIPLGGGVSRPLAPARNAGGGHWGARDILFSEGRTPLSTVSTAGGDAIALTTLDVSRQEVSHRWPQWLPDDEHFLYYIESGNPENSGMYLGSRDGAVKERLLDGPALHAPGYLVFVRNRVLYAQRFDERQFQLTGEPVALAADVAPPQATTNAIISVSREGTLAYGGTPATERFIWFDRSGREIGSIKTPAGLYNPRLTADSSALLAASGAEGGRRGIWLIDLERGEQTRLTEGMRPLSSPDAMRVVFTTDRATGVSDIYTRAVRGEDKDEILVQSPENKVSNDWSRDGRFFVFASLSPQTKWDIWTLPMDGSKTPRPLLQTPANENQAQLSPSGQWIAYNSDETGRFEVYLQSFPDGGNKRAVSVGGGSEPHWRSDERELYYLGPEGAVMAVDVVPGSPPRLGTPKLLFRVPLARGGINLTHYDVSPDGQRILVHAESPGEGRPSMQMLVNWTAAVPR